ncbi:MAG: hypothetical protein QOE54_2923 [Streptosporangiaceae bacterium]|nr:hypothetical protein [Streptosporangiaceae bacterium]MDX6430557.1 hypothetical protein [Streptosporangiaceae bacterium]
MLPVAEYIGRGGSQRAAILAAPVGVATTEAADEAIGHSAL